MYNYAGKVSFNHPFLFRAMNWWSIFIHELSHAITAIVTLNKIKEFKVSSDGGYVEHFCSKNFGFFQWVAGQFISVSPAFFPPIMITVFLKYLRYIDFSNLIIELNTFEPIVIIYTLFLGLIPHILETIGILLINLDYSRVENIVLLLILIFSFSAAKPSSLYQKNNGLKGDLQLLVEGFVKFPIYTILFLLLCTSLFWVFLILSFKMFIYVIIFFILFPIVSIFALFCNHLFIKLINLLDNSSKFLMVISLLIFILIYVYLPKYTEKQYLTNIVSISTLIIILKLSK